MKAASIIVRAVRELAVGPATTEQARAVVEAAGVKDQDAVQRLYKEWVNDLVVFVGQEPHRAAARAPDATFLAWLDSRLNDPYHVTYRAKDQVRAQHGLDLLLLDIRWRQEVAWARRMRGGDNDRIVFLAEMWLKVARKDPAKMFRGLFDVYAADAVFDPAYRDNEPFHRLDEGEILDGAVDDRYWRPLWLRFAEREFGRLVTGTQRGTLTKLAQQVRDAEWQERVVRARASAAERLRQSRPALMVGLLTAALDLGLSSDDVAAAEQRFIEDVESGACDLGAQANPPWRVLMLRLGQWAGTTAAPDEEERARRIQAIEALEPDWTASLPEDFMRLGASDFMGRTVPWLDAIRVEGSRVPPADPVIDYGMFLLDALGVDAAVPLV